MKATGTLVEVVDSTPETETPPPFYVWTGGADIRSLSVDQIRVLLASLGDDDLLTFWRLAVEPPAPYKPTLTIESIAADRIDDVAEIAEIVHGNRDRKTVSRTYKELKAGIIPASKWGYGPRAPWVASRAKLVDWYDRLTDGKL